MKNTNVFVVPETTFAALPACLDRFVFEEAGGTFEPVAGRAPVGLFAGPEELRRDLGTHFPRCFAEGRALLGMRLAHPALDAALRAKPSVRILDLGSGTGGFVAGLVWALREAGIVSPVTVTAVDGNERALEIQKRMWQAFGDRAVEYVPCLRVLPRRDWCLSLMDLDDGYDLVVASKFLGGMTPETSDEPFREFGTAPFEFLELTEQSLRAPGLAIINEVLSRTQASPGRHPLFAELLGRATIRHARRRHAPLRLVLPVPCALYGSACEFPDTCVQGLVTKVTHSGKPGGDSSHSVPRVWATAELVDRLLEGIDPVGEYSIATVRGRHLVCNGGCLRHAATRTPRCGYTLLPPAE